MFKKVLSLILSLMLVCSATSVSVLAAESLLYDPLIKEGGITLTSSTAGENYENVAYPTLKDNDTKNYKTNLTFDSATANVLDKNNKTDGLKYEDGKLSFYGGSDMGVRIKADDLSTFSGVVAIEAKVRKEIGTGTCLVGVENSNGDYAYKAEWVGDGRILSTYRSDPNSSLVQTYTEDAVNGEAKFVMFFDTKTNRLSVWVNDINIVDAYTFGSLGPAGYKIRNFCVYCDIKDNKVAIDDVKMYYCIPATKHRYETDLAHINEWTIPSTISSDLPDTAPYGSKVTWTSSDETIVDSNGVVTVPADDILHTVNLTANVTDTAENEKTQKAFVTQVAGTDYNAFPSLLANDQANYKTNLTFDKATDNVRNTKNTQTDLTFGGALSFTGAANYNGSTPMGVRIRQDAWSEFTGVLAIEATIKKSASKLVDIRLESTEGYNVFRTDWLADNTFSSYYRVGNKGADNSWNVAPIGAVTGEAKIIIFADSRTDRVAAWINGTKVADGFAIASVESSNRKFRNFYVTCADSSTKVTIDDVKMYYALPAVEHRLECDMVDFANFSIPSQTLSNMELPSKLTYGSYLTWTSDNEAVLSSEGVATRGNEDVVVNLTATPSANGQTGGAKTFAVTVKALQTPVYTVTAVDGSYKAQYFAVKDASGYAEEECYLVLYDGNELVSVKTVKIADVANDGKAPAAELEFTRDEITAFGAKSPKAKAFIWKSGSVVPLSTSVPVGAAN